MTIPGVPSQSVSLDGNFVTYTDDPNLTNQRIISPGGNVNFVDDGLHLTINAAATGGGAPSLDTYITVSGEPSLPNSRRLNNGNAITIVDNGPQGTFDIGVSSTLLNASFITTNSEVLLTGERRLNPITPLQGVDNGGNSTYDISIAPGGSTQTLIASGGNVTYINSVSVGVKVWATPGVYQLSSTSECINSVNCTSGQIILVLPDAHTAFNKGFLFKKTDSSINSLIVTPSLWDTVDGEGSQVLKIQYKGLSIISDGNEWLIV